MSDNRALDRKENIAIGILAHVDSGKTTLSEAILFNSGAIKTLGRVDKGNSLLDDEKIERDRGITVFSKATMFSLGEKEFTLIDTPGHRDFAGEMERVLSVLDYGILMINGSEGIQGHTMTLWKLLGDYKIPTLIFVNKMDQVGADSLKLFNQIKVSFGEGVCKFNASKPYKEEDAAMCSEGLMEEFLEQGSLSKDNLVRAFRERKIFPLMFGSALKSEGIEGLLEFLETSTEELGGKLCEEKGTLCKVYGISRDSKGLRYTHLRILSGKLKNKSVLRGLSLEGNIWEEKVDRIRVSKGGSLYDLDEAERGMTVAVTGLISSYVGGFVGSEADTIERLFETQSNGKSFIEPTMRYRVTFTNEQDVRKILDILNILGEENINLKPSFNRATGEFFISAMGELELDSIKYQLEHRFGLKAEFSTGKIIYKETIKEPISTAYRYENGKYYCQIHLHFQPLERGSTIAFEFRDEEDKIPANLRKEIINYFSEKTFVGPLTGSPLTDFKIVVDKIKGSNRILETEELRVAMDKALNQSFLKGLKENSVNLLEPIASFNMTLPSEIIGRVMTYLNKIGAKSDLPKLSEDGKTTIISGRASLDRLNDLQKNIGEVGKGQGNLSIIPEGYDVCEMQDFIIKEIGFNTEEVFGQEEELLDESLDMEALGNGKNIYADNKELEAIFLKTYGRSKRDEAIRRANRVSQMNSGKPLRKSKDILDFPVYSKKGYRQLKGKVLVIDGYNLIFCWTELKELAEDNLDGARGLLLDILSNYAAYMDLETVVVFDGYKVKGSRGSNLSIGRLKVVFTGEGQTADGYIAKLIFDRGKKEEVTIVSSDQEVQMGAMGDGALRLSSSEFILEILDKEEEIRKRFLGK